MIDKKTIIKQLEIKEKTKEWYDLLNKADRQAREEFNNTATIFAQIGLDCQKCPANCAFCSLAEDACCYTEDHILTKEEVVEKVKYFLDEGVDEIFLMTTACFSQELFLDYAKLVRSMIPSSMRLIANVGDFSAVYALKLKDAGITGCYHICRLGEGTDTALSLENRIQTLDSIREADLELYYCVEPIGPEHTNEEIAEELLRAIEYNTPVMAVMKRVAVKGTKLFSKGEISAERLATICAVSYLAVKPARAMGVHEPTELCLLAGANQLYAECGKNPRDIQEQTENGRGFSVERVKKLFKDKNWTTKEG